MRCSQPSPDCRDRDKAVERLVAERDGRQWCLFLDRDGVLNRQIVGDYVRSWADFQWLPGAKGALRILRDWAPYLVVVTNQQGVGKGLMGADDVADIHERLQAELALDGVAIDGFKVCPHLVSEDCPCRKPMPGLVLDWLASLPQVEPSLSVVVGDSPSDMELARNVGPRSGSCAAIKIGGAPPDGVAVDAVFDSIGQFAELVAGARRR